MDEFSDENGFTILELLLVLSIVSILTLVIIPIGGKWIKTMSDEKAIDIFITTVHSMQSYALANQIMTSVVVVPGNRNSDSYYKANINGNETVSTTYFPKGIRGSTSNGSLLRVDFHPDGKIIHSGTMTLLTDFKTYSIRFQFEKGRVIIHESNRPIMAGNDSDPSGTRRHLWDTFTTRNENDNGFA